MAAGLAVSGLDASPAEALDTTATTSILLYNRSTGAYRVFTPNSLYDPGTTRSGTDAARFANVTAATAVARSFAGTSSTVTHRGVLTLRGSTSVTPAWEVAGWNGTGWLRKAGGSLRFNALPWTPRGQLFDTGGLVLQLDTTQIASGQLSLTSTADTSWTWRTRAVVNSVQPFDSSFAIGCEAGRFYGMARSDNLSQFTAIEAGTEADLNIVYLRSIASQRGQVYTYPGRVMVYDRLTGVAQFYWLPSTGSLRGATLMLTARLAVGWTHVVPFRYGWFFYHRTRRLAQMGTVRSRFPSPGWRLVNGYLWPDNTLGDFTDAVGFG